MSFTLPSDDELRRLFSLLDKKDIAELTEQFDADVARARANQIQNSIYVDGGNSLNFSSTSKPTTSSIRGSVLSSDEYAIPKLSSTSSSGALVEMTVGSVFSNHNGLGNARVYTEAA
jgi:hypothetical protein